MYLGLDWKYAHSFTSMIIFLKKFILLEFTKKHSLRNYLSFKTIQYNHHQILFYFYDRSHQTVEMEKENQFGLAYHDFLYKSI